MEIQYIAIAIPSFLAGIFMGIIIEKRQKLRMQSVIAGIVTVVWTISVLAPILSPEAPQTPPLVHGIMGAIVAYFFKPVKLPILQKNEIAS